MDTQSDTPESPFQGPGGIKMLLAIALPMIVSNAAETIMMFVDRLFLSQLGREHLSAAMAGGLTMFMMMTFFMGIIGYVNALVAQYYGAKQRDQCGVSAAQGMVVAVVSYPLLLLAMPLGRMLLARSGHDPLQTELEITYFSILAYGSVMSLIRAALSSFFCGIGRTRMVMVANLLAMVVNVVANYILIFGHFGAPALGMRGAAYGTLIGSASGLLIMLIPYFSRAVRLEFATLSGLRLHLPVLFKLLRFGLPSGIEFFLNMAAFNIFVLLFHSYGVDAAAAITITFNWDLVAFLPMLGFNLTVMSLVGRYMGAGRPDLAERATYSGLKVASVYATAMAMLFLFCPHALVGVFSRGAMAAHATSVFPLAVAALRIAAFYTASDAAAIVFSGALRGAGDTRWTMWMSVGLHWLMAGASFVLIRVVRAPPLVSWILFTMLVFVLTLCLYLRFKGGKWRSIQVIQPTAPLPPLGTDAAGLAPPDVA
ncbi:MAG: MATE family efflux transporter [Verrucomicrobia bacterium]|nr:MATE family efflux transporter [Verrucomicrobiota bacterium]